MPTMTIRLTNTSFESASAGEYDTVEDAYRAGVAAGVRVAADEVAAGAASSVVEVEVDLVGRRGARRGVVAASMGRLVTEPPT